jgi:hypothetical protein
VLDHADDADDMVQVLFVWAGLYHMSRECLEQAWQEVVDAERQLGPNPAAHNKSLVLLLRGALCAQLGMYDQAYQYFDEVGSYHDYYYCHD